jgi:hypothetical protein
VRQVGINRRDDEVRFDRNEIDAAKGDAHPRVNNDPSIKHSIDHVDI